MGYRKSTPRNVIFAKSKTPPLYYACFIFLYETFTTRCKAISNHPILPILEEIRDVRSQPSFISRTAPSRLSQGFENVENVGRLIFTSDKSPIFSINFETLSL